MAVTDNRYYFFPFTKKDFAHSSIFVETVTFVWDLYFSFSLQLNQDQLPPRGEIMSVSGSQSQGEKLCIPNKSANFSGFVLYQGGSARRIA